MKKQRGYTLIELLSVGLCIGVVAVAGTAIYAVSHFVAKFW